MRKLPGQQIQKHEEGVVHAETIEAKAFVTKLCELSKGKARQLGAML